MLRQCQQQRPRTVVYARRNVATFVQMRELKCHRCDADSVCGLGVARQMCKSKGASERAR
eukprot:10369750-Lingulodinium_polyedra.AAC.1